MAGIQRKVIEQNGRNAVSRVFQASNDKDSIAAWKLDLGRILQVFNVGSIIFTWSSLTDIFQTELVMNIHVTVSDMRRDVSKIREEIGGQVHSVSAFDPPDTGRCLRLPRSGQGQQLQLPTNPVPDISVSIHGEPPPPRPRACFGRDELIERIVGLAEDLTPIALIGPGGIGKTSLALIVLHHDRIKRRFGGDRRFIRCDQFPASLAHFLSRLSKVIGADIENPEDLTPLRSFLCSREMIICLDNAESILDPRGTNAREIYAVVEGLSQFSNICLCITSRISTVPPDCKRLDIPTLSMVAACHTFYRIYDSDARSNLVGAILEQLDFHPLSITLLATVAYHNKWNTNRLSKEWERQRTNVLHTQHDQSLATTIELSLASPMFQELGPDSRGLLSVVAFLPQGVNESNLDWLFPTLSNRTKILDTFCVLSLTYRTNGFVTMLAPLRDHLCPREPISSPLLRTAKDNYFDRLSIYVDPGKPGFEDARWIASEDMNVEHLLDVFTSAEKDSVSVWDACAFFMRHLYWHKLRLVALGPKIEGLPDDHPSKPGCLLQLSLLFDSIGNVAEQKRLLVHALGLWRGRGDDTQVVETLVVLARADRQLGLYKEGIERAEEALEICERLNDVQRLAESLQQLAWSLYLDKQLDVAEEAALRVINLPLDEGGQYAACDCYRILGNIWDSRGETEKAINHYETALGIASSFNWHDHLFWINYSLAKLFFGGKRFDDAHARIERAKSFTLNEPYLLGRATELKARFWFKEHRLEEAKSEALRAVDVFKELGATKDLEGCRKLLRGIEKETKRLVTCGELLETMLLPAPANSPFSARDRA